jgi:holliday junction DNA helicase RuvA
MIAYINGLIIDKNEKSILVLAQSIGYKIFVNTELLSASKIDQKIQLFIHSAVREDDISLYGFVKKEELSFFEQLISVSGIGPKIAMDILSTPLHITKQAIINGDTGLLKKIKGLGNKTSERLILELKNKITPSFGPQDKEGGFSAYNDEAVEALVGLGYEKFQVIKIISQMPSNIKKTEDIVKYFLKKG